MGIGIYPGVMRVRPRTETTPEDAPTITLPGQPTPVTYEQIEAMSCHDDAWAELAKKTGLEWSLHRGPVDRYSMLGALGGDEHTNVKPMFPDFESQQMRAAKLMDWLNDQRLDALIKEYRAQGRWAPLRVEGIPSFEDEYLYDKGYTVSFFEIAQLRQFDYDKPVEVVPPNPETEIGTILYDQRAAAYAGKTYRDLFPAEWFEFLNWAHNENWDYLMFQTD